MKIILVNRFFFPDESATSQMASDLAWYLSTQGLEVAAITSRQRYENATAALPAREEGMGVRVFRVWSTTNGRARLLGRAFDYATFYVAAFLRLCWLVQEHDVLIAKTDPPLLSIIAAVVARVRRARLVNWSQDVFPEAAQAVGLSLMRGVLGRLITTLRDWSWMEASRNVAVGEGMAAYIKSKGIGSYRISVVHNWVDGRSIKPLAREANTLRVEWGLGDSFVVGYSGNLGRAHEMGTMADAIERLMEDTGIRFLFIGGGKGYDDLRRLVGERKFKNVMFHPFQPKERLGMSLTVPDVHLISLRSVMEGYVVPSKFYGVAAAGRPTVFIGDCEGEIARLVRENHCGCVIAERDGETLAACLRELRDNEYLRLQLGENARKAFDHKFDRAIALKNWKLLLEEVTQEQCWPEQRRL